MKTKSLFLLLLLSTFLFPVLVHAQKFNLPDYFGSYKSEDGSMLYFDNGVVYVREAGSESGYLLTYKSGDIRLYQDDDLEIGAVDCWEGSSSPFGDQGVITLTLNKDKTIRDDVADRLFSKTPSSNSSLSSEALKFLEARRQSQENRYNQYKTVIENNNWLVGVWGKENLLGDDGPSYFIVAQGNVIFMSADGSLFPLDLCPPDYEEEKGTVLLSDGIRIDTRTKKMVFTYTGDVLKQFNP